jgi:carboxymethylenebutenolidase
MSHLQLRAADGNELSAYLVRPQGTARGAVVVIQEIFGVNSHIRRVAEQYAAAGFLAIAPAMFDRQKKGVELGYDAAGIKAGMEYMMKAGPDGAMADVNAAIDAVAHAGKVGMVGYCWGGRVTYLAGCHTNIAAGVAYYGGGIAQLLKDTPRCPMMFHHGEKDTHISLADVDAIRKAFPQGVYHLYPADHGFNCAERASFDAPSAHLAFDRTIEFFGKHLGA